MEAIVRMREGDLERAAQLLREAVALHAERGEDARLMSARVNLCVVLHLAGQSEEAAEVVEAGLELAVATGHRMFESYLLINRARLRVEAGAGERDAGERDSAAAGDRGWGDSEGALEDARAALALAQELDVAYLRATAHGAAADALGRLRRVEEATAEADAAVREARAIGDALGLAEQLIITARVAADSGATDWALEVLEEVDGLLDKDVDHALRGHALQIRARLVTDPEERSDTLRRARDAFERAGARTRVAELDRADFDRTDLDRAGAGLAE
jgi:tetratricopeptide (TPR) repeat protein